MVAFLGVILTLLMVFGGYMLAGGKLEIILHALPFEMMIIGGAAVGAFIAGNNMSVIKHTGADFKALVRGPKFGKKDYQDLLCLLHTLIDMGAKDPTELERAIEDPENSPIFQAYPTIAGDTHAREIICDTLRSMIMNFDDAFQVEEMLEKQLQSMKDESLHGAHALGRMADALPALGIVAAVLGVIKTMASIDKPPEILGQMIGGALVGTFLGVFLAYGIVGPWAERIKQLREEDLIGYGIVVGLQGTGDTVRNSPYTEEALASLLERLGVNVQDERFRPDNVAAVIVTATLPPFARMGSRIDVSVSSIGDADSLQGGMLIMTPLLGADSEVYAVAQGPLVVGGFDVEGQAGRASQGTQTLATIAAGARVEREVPFEFGDLGEIRLALKDPDFTTAGRIEGALNTFFADAPARMADAGTVIIDTSRTDYGPAHLIAEIEGIFLTPDRRARVVIDQRSGTIVLGEDVRIAPVAVAQGALTIRVAETPLAVPAAPFSQGTPVVLPRTAIAVDEGRTADVSSLKPGASLRDLVEGLNALDVPPRDMVEIFEALRAAGALHAEIVLQ